MERDRNPVAQKLLEAFSQLRRLNWKHSPITGFKHSELMVLFCIKKGQDPESPGIKVTDISNALRVASPTVTQLIKGLETDGCVERTVDKEDRRAVRVKLTAKGESMVERASDAFYEAFNGLVLYLGEEKSNELTDLLSKVFVYFNERKKENF